MSSSLPQYLDVIAATLHDLSLQGSLPLATMSRLTPLLCHEEGSAEVRLSFTRHAEGHFLMAGTLETVLPIICQRCLEPMAFPLRIVMHHVILPSMEDAERFQEEPYEPVIAEGGSLNLWESLEDEILLAFPVVARHADLAQCHLKEPDVMASVQESHSAEAIQKKENPFAVLGNHFKI